MNLNVEAFVIALNRAKERHAQVARLQNHCPLKCQVIEAVDGSQLSASEREQVYQREIHRPRYPFELQLGEIGAFLSHRKAWAAIVEKQLDAGLILEDDIELELPGFAESLEFALHHLKPKDYVQFRVRRRDHQLPTRPSLTTPKVVPLGATSQIVGREAAARLLDLTEKFDRPIDAFVQMKWLTQIETLVVNPSCVVEISSRLGGTTVRRKSQRFWSRMYRNVMRPTYRAQLSVLSHWHSLVTRPSLQ